MRQEIMPNTFEFLEQEIYLPGYMTLASAKYHDNGAGFLFNVREPPVVRGSIVDYITPRGLHICISQAGYALAENLIKEGEFKGLDLGTLREILLQGRVKITELFQKFRKEVGIVEPIPGEFIITRMRPGKTPVIKLDFNFAEGAITGNLVSMIVAKPTPQLNQDIVRFQI